MLAFTFNLNVAREDDSCPCLFSRSYLKSITFLASFETLNIPITYELFCNSPKEGMIKGLWKNHSHESMVCTLNHPTARDSVSSDALVFIQLPASRFLKDRSRETLIPEQLYCSESCPTFLSQKVTKQLGSPFT